MKREVQSDIDLWKESTTLWLSSTGERIKEEEEDILFFFSLSFFLSFYFLKINSSFPTTSLVLSDHHSLMSFFSHVPHDARYVSTCRGWRRTIKRYHIESLTSGTHTTRGIQWSIHARSWFIPPSSSSFLWSMLEKSLDDDYDDYTRAYISYIVSQSSDNSFGPSIPSKQTTAHRSQGLS
jgi:hypothetical protein